MNSATNKSVKYQLAAKIKSFGMPGDGIVTTGVMMPVLSYWTEEACLAALESLGALPKDATGKQINAALYPVQR
jgi:hypothetical protein